MKVKFKSPKLHLWLAAFWAVIFIPIAMYWPESVLLVLFISCYANFVGHISSYEARASAGVDEATHRKLDALAAGLADLMEVLPSVDLKQDAAELKHVVGLEDKDD